MPEALKTDFFNRPTLEVAKDLLGKFIVRKDGNRLIEGMITETEAYIGPYDRAAHSYLPKHRRPNMWTSKLAKILEPYVEHPELEFESWNKFSKITPKTIAEYLDGGTVYIYLVYGMYWNANLSTVGPGIPECVLLRAVVPAKGKKLLWEEYKEANGPGKLCRYLHLDKSLYGINVAHSDNLWLEDRGFSVSKIKKGPRIGIDYAGPYWAKRHWRFWIETHLKNS